MQVQASLCKWVVTTKPCHYTYVLEELGLPTLDKSRQMLGHRKCYAHQARLAWRWSCAVLPECNHETRAPLHSLQALTLADLRNGHGDSAHDDVL